MSNKHHVIPRTDWFTPAAWSVLEPHIESMPNDGGCVVLVFDAQPDCRNYLQATVASFTGKQRAALRKALLKAKEEPKQ